MGKLYAVGFGPGGYEHMTAKAIDVIKNADVITGYTTYVEMLKKFFPDKEYVATPMTKEMDRCRMAVDLAAEGKTVAMVSSGDSGIYGMAGILLEIAKFPQNKKTTGSSFSLISSIILSVKFCHPIFL